jgi:hypothetical protein
VAPSHAQTSDVLFGGWNSRPQDVGSRPAGLGGAFVAVADDTRAAVTNPAGIALVPELEVSFGLGELWGAFATALRGETVPVSGIPTDSAGASAPCPPGPQPRPWALAFFGQQRNDQQSAVTVVSGPGLLEQGVLSADREQIGLVVARGLTPWLNLGLSLQWRHLRLEGLSSLQDAEGTDLQRVTFDGDANKARAVVGALATFGGRRAPTAFRIGVAYEHDLSRWTVERRAVDIAAGTVAPTTQVRIEEPPLLSAGMAWRVNEAWLLSGQLDYIWYGTVLTALADNQSEEADLFRIDDGLEPRFGIEYTRPSPIGGYLKLRAGIRRETGGRLSYEGTDLGRTQAFTEVPPAFRGAVGASLLAEFYERAARLDFDMSQVVVARTSSVSAAGTRRFSFNITVRL